MRVNIKTTKPIKDRHVRSLYLIAFALSLVEERMIIPTLEFFADRYGYRLNRKDQ